MAGEKEFTEVKTPVPWGFVTGKWWGLQGKQPILALHGWQDNAGTYDELVKYLPNDWSIYAVDLPGHGLSSHLPKGINYNLYWDGVIAVRRLIKYFGWKNVILMGHSMGGAISFLYAACYPDDVEAVISLDMAGPHVDSSGAQVRRARDLIEKLLKLEEVKENVFMGGSTYEDALNTVEDAYDGSLTRESCEIIMKRGTFRNPENPDIVHFSRDPRLKIAGFGLLDIDLISKFASKLKCRYLNIKAVPEKNSVLLSNYKLVLDVIEKSVKEFKYVEVNGTHHVHLNDASVVAPHISEFIGSEPCTNSA